MSAVVTGGSVGPILGQEEKSVQTGNLRGGEEAEVVC
eukprot:CAMPEP_0119138062 /NCGR_PEP_ID=MMETSP1310-20130426/24968_1 /TAXON_ID=464262 /ORGANISM="Genus nov. species nov., Strain RCC2339" /LENGTH=36 /DNA_ID= /DNA_START= /DNA_END= /DNA_ORIENTATION=